MNTFVALRILLSMFLLVCQGGRNCSICINAQPSLIGNDQSSGLSDVKFIRYRKTITIDRVVARLLNKVHPVQEEHGSEGTWPDMKLDGTGKTGSDVTLLCRMLTLQCATGNKNDRYGSAYIECLYRNCVRNRRKGGGMKKLQLGISTDSPYDHRGKPDRGDYEKRRYSDNFDVCVEMFCSGEKPGNMGYLQCISENHCFGR